MLEKYSKYLKDGTKTHCIYCNTIYPTDYIRTHYHSDYHLEQVCRKEFGMSAANFLSCEDYENKTG